MSSDGALQPMEITTTRTTSTTQPLTGVPLDACAVTLPYPEFSYVFQSRAPVSAEQIDWCLRAALDAANIGPVQFLFDHNHVNIGNVRRTSLMHLCTVWSDTERLGPYRGERMMEYLLAKGLDLQAPLPNGQYVEEQLELNGVAAPLAFLRRFLPVPEAEGICENGDK